MSVARSISILASLSCAVQFGCARPDLENNSAILSRVADQAASIARLEVQAQAAQASITSLTTELNEAKAALVASKDVFQKLNNEIKQTKGENTALAADNEALTKKLFDANLQIASLQNQLTGIHAEQVVRFKRLDAVGEWKSDGLDKLVLHADGTGGINSYSRRPYGQEKRRLGIGGTIQTYRDEEYLDYQIQYQPTREPGVYAVVGKWKQTEIPATGFFRVNSDGTAVLEGLTATGRPLTFKKNTDPSKK